MDLGSWWIVDVIGPVILLFVLIGTILMPRANRKLGPSGRPDHAVRELHSREERRFREGTGEF